MSREFCRDVPDPWGCSTSLCKKVRAHFSFPIFGFACLFSFPGIPCDFGRFSLLSQGFYGARQEEEILAFLMVFLAVFQNGKEKSRSGRFATRTARYRGPNSVAPSTGRMPYYLCFSPSSLDRYRAPSAIGSAIGRALSRPLTSTHR